MRIGLYGGSFNPVHAGHVGIARRAIAELALDRLLVIPAAVSPFKVGAGERAGFSPEVRLALVRAAFADVAGAEVDDRELRRGGVSYAIDTVRAVAAEHPGAELFFIVGEDSVAGLPHWKDYGELAQLCRFSPIRARANPRPKSGGGLRRASQLTTSCRPPWRS